MKPTYEQIAPLVQEYQVYQRWLHTTFACPATGYLVRARAEIQGEGERRDFWEGFKSHVLSAVGLLIAGMTGELDEARPEDTTHSYSEAQIQAAILDAFLSVRGCFRLVEGRWVARQSRPELSELERVLKANPIQGRREAELLTRCLSGLAELDGHTCPSERKFLARFAPAYTRLPGGMPGLDELSEIRPQARPTVFLLAQSLAMVDRDLCLEEREYLDRLAAGLGLESERAAALRKAAGEYIVSQSVGRGEPLSPDQVAQLHELTGLPMAEIERACARQRSQL